MNILVNKEGILSTVQDLGRCGYRRFGINTSGAMDRTAVRLLNQLLGNNPSASVLEMHFPAGEYLFEGPVTFAVGGADFTSQLSGRSIKNWTSNSAVTGDILRFANRTLGNRTYLAVEGGFDVKVWLGSSSTNLAAGVGGLAGRRLKLGDRIAVSSNSTNSKTLTIGRSLIPKYCRSPRIRVTAGPEFDALTAVSAGTFLGETFQISPNSDRMGFRLKGPTLHSLRDEEMLSSGVTFGTIQLLPDGQMIVLMADHQTTGGYPRIATVVSVDLPLLAQLGSGDSVSFELIEIDQAVALALELERSITCLRTGMQLISGLNL